jgi:dTDP-4-dehydrorhamnose reductase
LAKHDATRALVIGADGLIGKALAARLHHNGCSVTETTRRGDRLGAGRVRLDFARPVCDWRPPRDVDTVFLCAAATSLAYSRDQPAKSRLINVTHTVELARILAANGAFVVFLSTSRVFSGPKPHRPDDPPTPADEYARQKVEAEQALLLLGEAACVVRLTKVLGPDNPLIQSWRECLARGEVIRPFSDMSLSPLSTEVVTEALIGVARRRLSGIVHLSGSEAVTYAELAHHVARRLGADLDLVRATSSVDAGIDPEWARAATVLDATRMGVDLAIKPPDPFDEIDMIFDLVPGASP